MSVYKYIAQTNPNQANDFCVQNGLTDASDIDQIAVYLQTIVAQNGESALKKIMELHPDKDAILELFQKKDGNTLQITEIKPPVMMNATGAVANAVGETSSQNSQTQHTNTYILVAALIVSVAIISMKK
jgi:hypothetical protein